MHNSLQDTIKKKQKTKHDLIFFYKQFQQVEADDQIKLAKDNSNLTL